MDFIQKQEKMNLEVSSEYLVLAAELLEIKFFLVSRAVFYYFLEHIYR